MVRLVFPAFFFCLLCVPTPVLGDLRDHVWGGGNQETSFSPNFFPNAQAVTLVQHHPPQGNLGAPHPAIPVQAGHGTRAIDVPQAHLPTITIPTGSVGSIGQPATFHGEAIQAPPGAEIVFILPSSQPASAVLNIDGRQAIPATEARVVPPHTPGAIPVALQTVTVQRPRVEYHWTYGHIVNRMETPIQVVDPRTGRVIQSYNHEETHRSKLPWLHRREVITYETVEVQIAVPVSMAPWRSSAVNTFIRGGMP